MRWVAGVIALTAFVTSASAGRAPEATGPFTVGVTTLTFVDATRARTLITELWYPARDEGRDARLRPGRYPLVLVAHGLCGFRTNYEYLTVHLASWGFLVAAPEFPGSNRAECLSNVPFGDSAADLSFLRGALRDRAGPAGRFARAVRGKTAGLVGHSLGGLAVLSAAVIDPHLLAVVALAPAAGRAQARALVDLHPRRAVLAVGGTADTLVAFDGLTVPFFETLATPAFLVRIIGGTHGGFADVEGGGTRQQVLVQRYATAFLKRYLSRQRRFVRFLTAEDATGQGADVELTARPR